MTFEQIEKVLFGGVGLLGWEDLTVTQVLNAYNGYFDKENKRLELEWETTRWLAWIEWNLHVTKKNRLKDPRKLIKFAWDTKQEKPDMDAINKLFPDTLRHGNK